MPTTYLEIASHAWPLINQINAANSGAPTATAYLGLLAPCIAHHFPPGHLDKVRIKTVTPVPGVKLTDLETAYGQTACTISTGLPQSHQLGYTGLPCWLKSECQFGNHKGACTCGMAPIHAHVWDVLVKFTDPASLAALFGITYNDVIYLTAIHANDLQTIVHELVHTLQWKHFGAQGFLTRYIRGWAENWTNTGFLNNYFDNPAEKKAVQYQNLTNKFPPHTPHNVAAWRGGTAIPLHIHAALMAVVPVGITEANATAGM